LPPPNVIILIDWHFIGDILMISRLAAVSFVFLFSLSIANASVITGAGSTLAKPLYERWGKNYKAVSGDIIQYDGIGSGEGIKKIKAHSVDFADSDVPLNDVDLKKNHLMQFPIAIGAIVPVINLDEIEPGSLKLTGPVLADIFLGKIKKWNDPEITALNPDIKLPAIPIVVVHRSDSSGSTYLFTTYLSEVSPAWKNKIGSHLIVHWPIGISKKGSEELSTFVLLKKGAIGYVEYNYAQFMNFTQLQNKSGHFVQPSTLYLLHALDDVDWKNTPNFNRLLINKPGNKIWPLTAMTFAFININQKNKTKTTRVLKFFDWSFNKGKELAYQLYYVPIPEELVNIIESRWNSHSK